MLVMVHLDAATAAGVCVEHSEMTIVMWLLAFLLMLTTMLMMMRTVVVVVGA